ncbi:MAG: aminotransferase class I/II-fold pyridoxal phosphate-dependent enzyme, partial [Formivibrio sp.]|nr:aminotransferase class I/II-fold pyridoxal phosphate-dependent enzyme [Formivibrio sp.]
EYGRTRNPTRDQLANTIAKLERGSGAVVVASGMAAINLLLSRLGPDDGIVAPHDCYSGTYRLLRLRAEKRHFRVMFIDQGDLLAVNLAFSSRPKLVFIETPSNPLMRIVDIEAICRMAKAVGAAVAVDNTFMSPALQLPLTLGANFVVHSTTKYLNGHSDVIGGVVIASEKEDVAQLAEWANITGVTGSPFDAYQTLRGLRTLYPRMERQQQSAVAIADFLHNHGQVGIVHYPGLKSHPGHCLAKSQQAGFGAMLSFEINGGTDELRRFVEALSIFTLAESLGGGRKPCCSPGDNDPCRNGRGGQA